MVPRSHGGAGRRRADEDQGLAGRLGDWVRARDPQPEGLSPVLGGQLLLAAAGVAVGVGALLLRLNTQGWLALGSVSAIMLVALAMSAVLPWHRLPRRVTLVFPVLVCAGMVSLDAAVPGMAAPLTGVLTLCFAYLGLAHPSGSSLVLLPGAAATFVVVNGGLSRVTSVRLVLIALIWVFLAELLAALTTRQRVLAEALRTAAHTDVLTGIGNRREIDLRLLAARPGDVIVLCDLDHFKALNDTHGHLVGDRVLSDFGALLRAELRDDDIAGRFGGEEFLLLLPATTPTAAARMLASLHASWTRTHPEVTFSTGAAAHRQRPVAHTLAAADEALYAAKAAGRNTDRSGDRQPAGTPVSASA
jgi:diguanylate cyclase (GGDEF)-like protein